MTREELELEVTLLRNEVRLERILHEGTIDMLQEAVSYIKVSFDRKWGYSDQVRRMREHQSSQGKISKRDVTEGRGT